MQVAEVAWEEAWGSILNLHIANNFSLLLHLLCTRFASSLFNRVYITKNVPKTCYRRKMLLVEQTGGKFAYLFKSQRQQATPCTKIMDSVVFDHPRSVCTSVHVMKSYVLLHLLIT